MSRSTAQILLKHNGFSGMSYRESSQYSGILKSPTGN